MSISTAAERAAPSMTLSKQLNAALAAQSEESPMDYRDTCDTCPTAARAVFVFPVAEIMLCGHHMRLHLENLMANGPSSFWIAPAELWSIGGVETPAA